MIMIAAHHCCTQKAIQAQVIVVLIFILDVRQPHLLLSGITEPDGSCLTNLFPVTTVSQSILFLLARERQMSLQECGSRCGEKKYLY